MKNRFDNYLINRFKKSDEKNKVNNENQITNDNNINDVKTKGIPKKRKKKLLIWMIVIILFSGILAIILYFSLRKTEVTIGNVNKIEVNEAKNQATLTYNGGSKTISINPNNNGWCYYIGNNTYEIYADLVGDNLPLKLRVNTTFDQNGNLIPTYINGFQIYKLENNNWNPTNPQYGENTQLYKWLSVSLSNWVVENPPFNWLALITALIPILFYVFLLVIILKASKMQAGGAFGDLFGSGKGFGQFAKSTTKFTDVAGIKEEKEELLELVDYLKKPNKYANMGARPPKGVILYGPPGTGKTLLAKAVAGEANVPFIQTSGSQFEDMLVGVGAKRVRELFTNARKVAPAIIFIDEIDSVANKRGSNNIAGAGGGVADQTINQLLAEMDGFNPSSGIVVIAATNRLDVLDDAILRPGRFDRHIQVNLPDIKEREEILKIHSRNKNISSKVDLYDIARRTPGFSGAQLENVLNEATLLAVRQNKTTISEEDIDEGIDRTIGGPAKRSRTINQEERKLIAYHEAGHALVGLYSKGSDIVEKITIIPRGNAGGYTLQTPEDVERMIKTKQDLLNIVCSTLGGRAAEEIVYGAQYITTGASNDLYKVTNIVRSMVMQLGMSDIGRMQYIPSEGTTNPYQEKLYSDKKANEIDNMIEKIIDEQYQKAKALIKKNRKELDLIVDTLLTLETIYRSQIEYIHKHKKLPPEVIEFKQKNNNLTKKKTSESKKETKIIKDDKENTDNTNKSSKPKK